MILHVPRILLKMLACAFINNGLELDKNKIIIIIIIINVVHFSFRKLFYANKS